MFVNETESFAKQSKYGFFPAPPPAIAHQKTTEVISPVSFNDLIIKFDPPDCVRHGRIIKSCREIRETVHGKKLWDLNYGIDEFKRRITPGEDQKKASKFLLTIGDSFVFGVGVPDHGTKSFFLAKEFPDHRVYNYGIRGGYPGEILQHMQQIRPEELKEKEGIALYFMQYTHIARIAGMMKELGTWSWRKAHYSMDAEGKIIRKGTYETERPWLVWFAKLTAKSNILSYYNFNPVPDDDDLRVMAGILRDTEIAVKKIGGKEFYVIVTPGPFEVPPPKFYKFLEEYKIKYVDLTRWELEDFVPGHHSIPYDGHPTMLNNEKVIEALGPTLREICKDRC